MMREHLEKLARTRDPNARSELIRLLSAQYAAQRDQKTTSQERNLFCALVLDVFEQLNQETRMDIVVRLAKTSRITTELADRLTRENFELSEPVFEHSPMVSHHRLMEVVQAGPDRRRVAIARRSSLPASLVDRLLAQGSFPVVNALLQNPGAHFSTRALLALLIQIASNAPLMGALAQRCVADETFDADMKLIAETDCPLVPPPLRKALFDASAMDELIKTAITDAKDTGLTIAGQKLTRHEIRIQIASGELSFEAILLTLIKQDRMDAIIWLTARQLNLRDAAVRDTFSSGIDGAIAVLMKSASVSPTTYGLFLRLRNSWLGRSQAGVADAIMRYKTMYNAHSAPSSMRVAI